MSDDEPSNLPAVLNIDTNLTKPIERAVGIIEKSLGQLWKPVGRVFNAYADGVATGIEARAARRIEIEGIRHQQNIEAITRKTMAYVQCEEGEEPSEDWIRQFFLFAQDCSEDNMQHIWAKLLAGEIDSPGAISRRLLNCVRLMSQDEAQAFMRLSQHIWTIKEATGPTMYGMVIDYVATGEAAGDIDVQDSWTVGIDDLHLLQDIDLCTQSTVSLSSDTTEFTCGKTSALIRPQDDADDELEIYTLTRIGVELMTLAGDERNEAYANQIIQYLDERKLIVVDP